MAYIRRGAVVQSRRPHSGHCDYTLAECLKNGVDRPRAIDTRRHVTAERIYLSLSLSLSLSPLLLY